MCSCEDPCQHNMCCLRICTYEMCRRGQCPLEPPEEEEERSGEESSFEPEEEHRDAAL